MDGISLWYGAGPCRGYNASCAPVAQRIRASGFELADANLLSAASGVAYAETCGAISLLSWTEDGPKLMGVGPFC